MPLHPNYLVSNSYSVSAYAKKGRQHLYHECESNLHNEHNVALQIAESDFSVNIFFLKMVLDNLNCNPWLWKCWKTSDEIIVINRGASISTFLFKKTVGWGLEY